MAAQIKPRFKSGLSIRYKFLSVTTALLVFCVAMYLLLASHIFKRDKTELVFDLTRSMVVNLATETDTLFRGMTDKMKLVALLSQEESKRSNHIVTDLFQNDPDVVFMARLDSAGSLSQVYFQDSTFLQTYELDANYYQSQLLHGTSLERLMTDGQSIWNATRKDGPPLIGFAKNVILESRDGVLQQTPFALVALLRVDRLLKSSSHAKLSQVLIANRYGEALLDSSSNTSEAWSHETLTQHHLYKLAHEQPVKAGVAQYAQNGEEWLGAYSYGFEGNLLVFSQVSGAKAFSVVDRLLVRSLLFALIVATLAFIAAIFFSRSLTRPILKLVEGMSRVADGDLKTTIDVRSRDEIATLAHSFNSMIEDLRESREQLEEINRDLEKKVHDRTQKLAEQNETVKKTQEALLQTTRLAAVGEIAGRAAHEVLNPLTSIITRLEKVKGRIQAGLQNDAGLLGDISAGWEKDFQEGGFDKLLSSWKAPSALNPQEALWDEDLRNIKLVQSDLRTEVDQLVKDTDFLLKEGGRINKIVQGMRSLTIVKGDLREHSIHKLLHESMNIMADLSQHSRVEIIEAFQAPFDIVAVDGDEFIQSATNLIRNSLQALRAANVARGRIVLRTTVQDRHIFVEIEDNGPGISPDHQMKLFENQFSTKSSDEGTGLGLSISRRFIRAYGGDIILLHSQPGETIFRISLPLDTEQLNVGGQAV